jgi:predicted enzyme related to lactoylglutathione lyase
MSERNGYENGVPCWVVAIQPDCHAGAEFYGELFGWDTHYEHGFFTARLRGRDVAAVAPLPQPAPPAAWITNVYAEDPDATAETARAAGGTVLAEPFDNPQGRLAVIQDPTGATFGAWRPEGVTGAQVVNEPSAWAMSRLETPDPEAAAAFYGAVFGWTTEAFGPVTMFRLPGYVGGEPEQPVSREVVALMSGADGPGRWIPDFWVSDADGTAARAGALGGAQLAAPFDTPMSRTAVLADPFGAAFSVTQMRLGHEAPAAGAPKAG